ncbi:MAG: helix-turn-helix transcriptional regulator [Pseudomonadota bacterium]
MTFDETQPDSEQFEYCFKVGNFSLRAKRSCAEAREQLGLSQREVELMMWVCSGLTKKQIALRMGVSPATVDTFRRRAYVKLGVGTSAAAASILTAFLAGTSVKANALAPAT